MSNLVSVEAIKHIGSIEHNLEAVKQSVIAICEDYKNIVVTEDNIKDSKKLVADIRKDKKALDDSRKSIKKEFIQPYEVFEAKAKEIIALYDEPINMINSQLAAYEEERREEKRVVIKGIYDEVKGDMGDWLSLNDIYDAKWENATYSDKNIREDMQMIFDSMNIAISTIKSMESEFEQEGLKVLKATRDIQRAVKEITDRKRMKEDIIAKEQAKAEEYARQKALKEQEELEKAQIPPLPVVSFTPADEQTFIKSGPEEHVLTVRVKESDMPLVTMFLNGNNIFYEEVE